MPSVTGFFHSGITVSDMERALLFYRDGLGLEVEWDRRIDAPYVKTAVGLQFDHVRVVYLRLPAGGFVELLQFSGIEQMSAAARPCDFGSGHLCLYVDDVEAMHARLAGLGFRARSAAVVDITAGPNQGARSVYELDPDGYPVELFQRAAGK